MFCVVGNVVLSSGDSRIQTYPLVIQLCIQSMQHSGYLFQKLSSSSDETDDCQGRNSPLVEK